MPTPNHFLSALGLALVCLGGCEDAAAPAVPDAQANSTADAGPSGHHVDTGVPTKDAAGTQVDAVDAMRVVDTGPVATLRTGLAGAWSFDQDGRDHSGNMLPLDLMGLSHAAAKFGSGIVFTGVQGQRARQPKPAPALSLSKGDFTVSLWVKITEKNGYVWLVGDEPGGPGWGVGISAGGTWVVYQGGSDFLPGGNPPGDGGPHHLLFERAGSVLRFYMDGVVVGMNEMAKPPAAVTPGTLIVGGSDAGFKGWIDDLAIWTRTLTAGERASLATHPVP